jgi:hypothetical protein
MSEVEFKTTMKQNAGVYIYRLVDEQGNVLKYGTTTNPFKRIYNYKNENFFEMEVVSGSHARAQALAGETSGAEALGETGLNVPNEHIVRNERWR